MADVGCFVDSIILSELLCYIQNNFSKSTYEGLLTAISGFYTVEEIVAAKTKLFDVAKVIVDDGRVPADSVPRMSTRRPGNNKRRLDTTDILELFGVLDQANITLPSFVALNLSRVPPFMPDATDFCALAASVEYLHGQMADVMKILSQHRTIAAPGEVSSKPDTLPSVDTCSVVSVKGSHGSFSDAVRAQQTRPPTSSVLSSSASGQSSTVEHSKRLHGSRSVASTKVKTVPRRPTAFVGRLHLDTTEEELTSFLTDAGIKDVKCRKLAVPAGRSFRTAAFQVSCADSCRERFYDESTWPEGAELRDWYFTGKPRNSTSEDAKVTTAD